MGTLNLSQYREVLENCASATEVVSPEVSHALPIGHRFSGSVGSSNVNLDIAETRHLTTFVSYHLECRREPRALKIKVRCALAHIGKDDELIPGMITLLSGELA